MGRQTIHLAGEAAMLAFGASLAPLIRAGDILMLEGGLGAGKTTLARGLLAALGLEGEAPSPTFAIVQPYAPPEVRLPVAHVDLYRIDDPNDIAELGLDELLADGALLIEWPDRLGERWIDQSLRVYIDGAGEAARRLTVQVPEAWKGRWPQR